MDPEGYGKEVTLAQARRTYGRPLVAATLAHLRAEDWPEDSPISVQFFERMKHAIEAYKRSV